MCAAVSAAQSYGRPQLKAADSIDAIVQPDKMFVMTMSRNRNIAQEGLAAALAGMRSKAPGSVTVYIAVPDSQFANFNSLTLSGPAGAAVPWPASVAQPLLLSIPMQSVCSVSGHVHARADPVAAAKLTLQWQAPPVPGGDAVIDALLAHQQVTSADVAQLAIRGLVKWDRPLRTWTHICDLPAANPICSVFRRQGHIIYTDKL
jgi:hypothetical protein